MGGKRPSRGPGQRGRTWVHCEASEDQSTQKGGELGALAAHQAGLVPGLLSWLWPPQQTQPAPRHPGGVQRTGAGPPRAPGAKRSKAVDTSEAAATEGSPGGEMWPLPAWLAVLVHLAAAFWEKAMECRCFLTAVRSRANLRPRSSSSHQPCFFPN